MNRSWKKAQWLAAVVLLALVIGQVAAVAAESGYSTGTTSATITFGPVQDARRIVKAVDAQSDVAQATITYYWRPAGTYKYGVNTSAAFAAANATNLYIAANTSLTNGDKIVYVHNNGTCDYLSMIASGATPSMTNIYTSSGITIAATNGDYIYEVQEKGGVEFGYIAGGAVTTSNGTYSVAGDALVATPTDSPLVGVVNGTARCRLQLTVE